MWIKEEFSHWLFVRSLYTYIIMWSSHRLIHLFIYLLSINIIVIQLLNKSTKNKRASLVHCYICIFIYIIYLLGYFIVFKWINFIRRLPLIPSTNNLFRCDWLRCWKFLQIHFHQYFAFDFGADFVPAIPFFCERSQLYKSRSIQDVVRLWERLRLKCSSGRCICTLVRSSPSQAPWWVIVCLRFQLKNENFNLLTVYGLNEIKYRIPIIRCILCHFSSLWFA